MSDSIPIRRQTRPIHVVPNLKLHDTVLRFFESWGEGPFEMEAICFFLLQEMAVTPYDYATVNLAVKQYLIDNFKISQGRLRSPQNVHLRFLLVSLK